MGQSPCLGIKTRKIKAPARRLANRSAALGQTINLVSGVAIVWTLGDERSVALSMAPKAVTTPITMAVPKEIGAIPTLAPSWAVSSTPLLKHLCIDDWRAHRLAANVPAAQVTAHSELNAAFTALGTP